MVWLEMWFELCYLKQILIIRFDIGNIIGILELIFENYEYYSTVHKYQYSILYLDFGLWIELHHWCTSKFKYNSK